MKLSLLPSVRLSLMTLMSVFGGAVSEWGGPILLQLGGRKLLESAAQAYLAELSAFLDDCRAKVAENRRIAEAEDAAYEAELCALEAAEDAAEAAAEAAWLRWMDASRIFLGLNWIFDCEGMRALRWSIEAQLRFFFQKIVLGGARNCVLFVPVS